MHVKEMKKKMEIVTKIIEAVNNLLWGKNILVVMLIGTAIFMTIRTKGMQFRLFKDIIGILKKNEKSENGISSLETFFLGTACRVGAGNITGVVAAISVGGSGSIFWMWAVALLGAATSFVESTLAVIYRKRIGYSEYRGGTPWIIEKRLNKKWLGVVYALSSIVCYMGVIQVMSNSVTESVNNAYGISITHIAIAFTVLVGIILFAKSKKDTIILTLNKIVPLMAALYLLIVLYIIVTNFTAIPGMITNIFHQAFGGKELLGGGIGVVIMNGVRRGLFSNEAGSGNSNYAAAVADVDEPVKQGMVQALGVFMDTLVVCSATAFIVLLAKEEVITGKAGMAMFQAAIEDHIGWFGVPFSVVILFFFSLSTILGVAYYGKNAISFISNFKVLNFVYYIIVIAMVYIGCVEKNVFVWSLADFGLGIMTVINIVCLVPISGEAISELKKYEKKLKLEKLNK